MRAGLMLALLVASAGTRADPPATPLPQVTVEADRATLERRVFNFVSGITHSSRGDSLRIWRAPICPLVAGLGSREQAEFILARISQAAHAAGAPLDDEKCRPNLYVVFSNDPDLLVRTWRERSNRTFGGVRGTPAAVDRFVASSRPVRVWYNREFGAADGGPVSSDSSMEGFALNGSAAVINKRVKDTRLSYNEVMLFSSVIVVVDGNQVAGLGFGALADYIAMAALTEVDLDAPLGTAPTILQLFSARAAGVTPPAELTAWDASFLKALYGTPIKEVMQRSYITTDMMRALAP